ncbi:MAG TPA: acetyltransferase [Acidimicrobiia bacterium]|nr:acetyltransferase [Acidimicrobiia bacterium]
MTASSQLLLVGAGGLGRETAAAARAADPSVQLAFLDDARPVGSEVDGVPVVGAAAVEAVRAHPDASLVVCTASSRDPGVRRRLVDRLGGSAGRWASVVHPAAVLDSCTPGPGSITLAGVVATAAVTVGAHVVLMPTVVLTHDVVVEDHAVVASGVRLSGAVHVEADAYLGAGSVVREGCRVGAGAVVGMGAVVLDDVPAGEVWIGNPARRLR